MKKQFCPYCGTKLEKKAQFCKNCGEAIHSDTQETHEILNEHAFVENPAERKAVYEGYIHKCPNCGELLSSFTSNCPACGYEIRNIQGVSSVKQLSMKLEQLEAQRPRKKKNLFLSAFSGGAFLQSIDKQKIDIIKNFPIPNTKEDILEFIMLAATNVDSKMYGREAGNYLIYDPARRELSDAWLAKLEQASQKAELSFQNTPEFTKAQAIYERKISEVKKSKKERKNVLIGSVAFLICFIVFTCILSFTSENSNYRKVSEENARLEAIVEEVYAALEDEDYTLARAKAASLTFSGPNTITANKASEKWDKTRSELFAAIDATAGENFQTTSGSNNPTDDIFSSFASADIPETFTAGYEKAVFAKYNSPASENGLGNSRIYFYCILDKTEIIETNGNTVIAGYVTDDSGNEWAVVLHFVPAVSKNAFDSYIGKALALRGVYSGFSKVKEMPVIVLDEMIVLDTSENVTGIQKIIDYSE